MRNPARDDQRLGSSRQSLRMVPATLRNDQLAGRIPLHPGAHFGNVTEVHDFGGLLLAESHYTPGLTLPPHTHESASFTFVRRGAYVEEHATRQFACVPGKVLFRGAGQRHSNRFGPHGADCLMLEVPRYSEQRALRYGPFPSDTLQLWQVGDWVLRLRKEIAIADALTPLAIEALLLEMICHLHRARTNVRGRPLWLTRVRDRLHADFAEKHSLTQLAEDAGVHPTHLARVFRREFGCSLGEYLRRQRLLFASEQMLAGAPLSDVAITAGFSNQAHFSRTFKAMTGLSPGQFRRANAKPLKK
jgi:AraC family transcriptional regulator